MRQGHAPHPWRGVVIHAATEKDRAALATCETFAHAGLTVGAPKKRNPRVIVYDIPRDATDENLLRGIYEKCEQIKDQNEFVKNVRVVRRMDRRDSQSCNVIMQMSDGYR